MGRPARLNTPVLPDLLRAGLRLVICGSAAGTRSAQERAYYAHPANRFWPTLHAAGLTPRRLRPDEYPALLDLGIGLTDVCKTEFGADSQLSAAAYDPDTLLAKIRRYQPRAVAFNGLSPARSVLGRAARYGRQKAAATRRCSCCHRPRGSPAGIGPSVPGMNWPISCAWCDRRRLHGAAGGVRVRP